MMGQITDLANYSDERAFATIAEGLPLIANSAEKLDTAANQLFDCQEYRGSEILGRLAEEEASKILILLDFVRCPCSPDRRSKSLKHFYNHTAKLIYSMTCSFSNPLSYGKLVELIELERQPYYLDGPRLVDWIFPNSISSTREGSMYVDYVRDVTDPAGDYFWTDPINSGHGLFPYRRPDSVQLCTALCEMGFATSDGLGITADIWRSFEPIQTTSRAELRELIEQTLEGLVGIGLASADNPAGQLIWSNWTFPLWGLELSESKDSKSSLSDLRDRRNRAIEQIQNKEARRDPALTIGRTKVEELSKAYAAWFNEAEMSEASKDAGQERGLQVRNLSEFERRYKLSSYRNMQMMFGDLSLLERTELLALAWFVRDDVADWPDVYKRAKKMVDSLDQHYQLRLGKDWLAGLVRWEQKPRKFNAGLMPPR